ncbi:WxL domain-containing protein [Enterococcus plantarum]|uniref:WxL domain-containing protein n=1 Tax=Enterococcus TaxID=1350 RepID=UPI001A8CAF7E|nr:WxL domain-containing protein [Enterococcus plantarum]MBO0424191.1 WxL domain-containing protein [Enterococcus plantarum]
MKIKKLVVGTSMLVCTLMLSATSVVAEEIQAKSEVSIDVTPGELELVAARPLEFGEIKYSSTKQSIPARINNIHSYRSAFVEPLPQGWAGGPSNPSLIDIKDDRVVEKHNWVLLASMAPLKNKKTGFEITNANLILKNPTDHYKQLAAYNGAIQLKSDNTSVPIVLTAGDYGQGRHAISFFNNLDIVGASENNYAIYPGPYTTNDIILEIPSGTPSQEGSLSTEITWTLTDTPGEFPIEVE